MESIQNQNGSKNLMKTDSWQLVSVELTSDKYGKLAFRRRLEKSASFSRCIYLEFPYLLSELTHKDVITHKYYTLILDPCTLECKDFILKQEEESHE